MCDIYLRKVIGFLGLRLRRCKAKSMPLSIGDVTRCTCATNGLDATSATWQARRNMRQVRSVKRMPALAYPSPQLPRDEQSNLERRCFQRHNREKICWSLSQNGA